ncbi:hypothetical protein ACHAWF_008510 [Thalassiosira exigua]
MSFRNLCSLDSQQHPSIQTLVVHVVHRPRRRAHDGFESEMDQQGRGRGSSQRGLLDALRTLGSLAQATPRAPQPQGQRLQPSVVRPRREGRPPSVLSSRPQAQDAPAAVQLLHLLVRWRSGRRPRDFPRPNVGRSAAEEEDGRRGLGRRELRDRRHSVVQHGHGGLYRSLHGALARPVVVALHGDVPPTPFRGREGVHRRDVHVREGSVSDRRPELRELDRQAQSSHDVRPPRASLVLHEGSALPTRRGHRCPEEGARRDGRGRSVQIRGYAGFQRGTCEAMARRLVLREREPSCPVDRDDGWCGCVMSRGGLATY